MDENKGTATFTVTSAENRLQHVKAHGHRTEYVSGAFAADVGGGPTQVVLFRDVVPDVVEVINVKKDAEGKPVSMATRSIELPGGPRREDVVTLILTDEALRNVHNVLAQHLARVNNRKGVQAAPKSGQE